MTEPFFIKLENPTLLQVNMLSASKTLLEITKTQLHLQKISKDKMALKDSLHGQLQKITDNVVKLQEKLPHADLLSEFNKPVEVVEKIEIKTPSLPKKIVTPKPSSDLDKLNVAIAAIEEKLAALK